MEGFNPTPGMDKPTLDLPSDLLAEVLRQLDFADSLSAIDMPTNTVIREGNGARHDPVSALPPELVAEIFRQLDFDSRLAVSHVSKSWRRAALSDRLLWSEYSVPIRGAVDVLTRRAVRGITALLSRSSPLPFRLYCQGAVPSAIVETVLENRRRLEILHLGVLQPVDCQRLLTLEAPLLRRFACLGPEDVPATISAGWALHLEHLAIESPCTWPAGCVFSCLRSFSGRVAAGRGFDAPISRCFPNLRKLVLSAVTQTSIESMAPLPASLAVLKLETLQDVDCAELLRNCAARDLRELDIYHVGATSSVLEALRLFTRTVSGPWKMQVTGTAMLLWALPYHYVVYCTVPRFLSLEPGLPSLWDRLCELHLSISDFEHLMINLQQSTVSPALVLPILSVLNLSVAHGYRLNPAAAQNSLHIHAPGLRSVELCVGPSFESLLNVVRLVLRAVLTPLPLERLIVRNNPSSQLDMDRVHELQGLVGRVELRNFGDAVYGTFQL